MDQGDRGPPKSHSHTGQDWDIWEMVSINDDPAEMTKTKTMETMDTLDILRMQTQNDDLMKAYLVKEKGYPNRYRAKIPVDSKWNLQRFAELSTQYEDKEVVEWMKYGWPSGRLPTLGPPAKMFKNQKGATDYLAALKKYIRKELEKGAVLGPFQKIPFKEKVGISPISTQAQKTI